jgi:hypothetical protein
MLLVPERRRSRRASNARSARSERSERSNQARDKIHECPLWLRICLCSWPPVARCIQEIGCRCGS